MLLGLFEAIGFDQQKTQQVFRLGVFFRDDSLPVYDEVRAVPPVTPREKINRLNKEFERYAV